MTNLGPLTTTYTPISSERCSSIYLATDSEGFWLERGDTSESCFPTNFTPIEGYYYSPGICQPGYTYACTSGLGSGRTAATCCPSRESDDNAACQSVLKSDSSYIGVVISYPDGVPTTIGTTTTLIGADETVYAIGVPVRRAATDVQWNIASTSLSSNTRTQTEETSRSSRNTFSTSTSMRSATDLSTRSAVQGTSVTSSPPGGTEQSTTNSPTKTNHKAVGVGAIVGAIIGALLVVAIGLEEQMGRQEMNARTAPVELNGHWQPVELG
ncbi:hypothetical protein NPX13_g7299 [Xylaria arbuscula]|uniref:Uncharacterized protein n=1 Tax=Xylaria arbuscula TaxID=114810 RepID=A0A9W8NA94_9PEZI|nr:hypothetical protein NPX13_g7299 [Xylaria arbuscula]